LCVEIGAEGVSMRRRSIVLVSLAAVSVGSLGFFAPEGCAKAKVTSAPAATTTVPVSRDAAIKAKLADLQNAVATGNSKAMAALWTDDGRYVDDDGNEYIGRTALEKNFAALFEVNGKAKVTITPENVRFPANNVALVDGIVKRNFSGDSTAIPVSRYSMVLEQRAGAWQIASATETPILSADPGAATGLAKLNWMIGEWTAKRNGEEVRMKAEWAPSRNFILMSYNITKPGGKEARETEVIGWDPRTQQPISWRFDSSGGFGQGRWLRSGGQWLISTEGVERVGASYTATNVISQGGRDSFTWQSLNRRVNGTLVEDTQPVKVDRVGTNTASK
jgi:uncharacterized protein (TIGR02246 family)